MLLAVPYMSPLPESRSLGTDSRAMKLLEGLRMIVLYGTVSWSENVPSGLTTDVMLSSWWSFGSGLVLEVRN